MRKFNLVNRALHPSRTSQISGWNNPSLFAWTQAPRAVLTGGCAVLGRPILTPRTSDHINETLVTQQTRENHNDRICLFYVTRTVFVLIVLSGCGS